MGRTGSCHPILGQAARLNIWGPQGKHPHIKDAVASGAQKEELSHLWKRTAFLAENGDSHTCLPGGHLSQCLGKLVEQVLLSRKCKWLEAKQTL